MTKNHDRIGLYLTSYIMENMMYKFNIPFDDANNFVNELQDHIQENDYLSLRNGVTYEKTFIPIALQIKQNKVIIHNEINRKNIIEIIKEHYNRSNIIKDNVINNNIVFVCEYNTDIKQSIVIGVRINDLFFTCQQLEVITNKTILESEG